MKKTSMSRILLLLPALGLGVLYSCQKEQPAPPVTAKNNHARTVATRGVSVSPNGYLVFSDETAYNGVLDDLNHMSDSEVRAWEGGIGYTSLWDSTSVDDSIRARRPFTYKNTTADADQFRQIITRNGLIQIGSYLFRAVADSGYVDEINAATNEGAVQAFIAGGFIDGVSNRFDMDESEAFQKLDAGLKGYKAVSKGTGLFGTDDKYNDDISYGDAGTWRADTKAGYQKAVFYFSLETKMKYQWKASNGIFWHPWNTKIEIKFASYKWDSRNGTSGNSPMWYDFLPNGNVLGVRFYSGSRGLNSGWHLYVQYVYGNNNAGSPSRTSPHYLQVSG